MDFLSEVFPELSEEDFKNYPGSKVEREEPDAVDEYEDDLWDDPVVYEIDGVDVEFFTCGQLGRALGGRQAQTIRRWERRGEFPAATFRTNGKRQDRLYTRAQVEGVVAIAREEGLMDAHKRVPLGKTRFSERCFHLWKRLAEIAA